MAEATLKEPTEAAAPPRPKPAYTQWIESTGVPVHRGYFVEDLRTLELGRWDERECNAAFLELAGQEGVSEARVTEIGPGQTLPPMRFALDEVVYVVEGRGLTTTWGADESAKKTFEWTAHSMFMLPRNSHHQFSNTQGNARVRLLHYNYLPMAMHILPDPNFFFNNPYSGSNSLEATGDEFYSQAKVYPSTDRFGKKREMWYGNFFPDMLAWDRLHNYEDRGAGGSRVGVQFPNSPISAHMSVFPVGTYKKGHRHGPGVVIVIPGGEGYSLMNLEGQEKVTVPWHEASVFVPPDRWFHQHFNVGKTPARYLAFHAVRPGASQNTERIEDVARDQIEYVAEDPAVRARFQDELGKRGLKSLMHDQVYTDPNYNMPVEQGED
jgi:oxalate decarboxylase/phosphoglucose isomerase-like protein (cupin superfamily)/quercetin dioxygenase-like cupin family protein